MIVAFAFTNSIVLHVHARYEFYVKHKVCYKENEVDAEDTKKQPKKLPGIQPRKAKKKPKRPQTPSAYPRRRITEDISVETPATVTKYKQNTQQQQRSSLPVRAGHDGKPRTRRRRQTRRTKSVQRPNDDAEKFGKYFYLSLKVACKLNFEHISFRL